MRISTDEKVRFSQHYADVLVFSRNLILPVPVSSLSAECSQEYRTYIFERYHLAEQRLREMGRVENVYYATCHGFAENTEFIQDMEDILRVLQREYDSPVDIEYTVNISDGGEYIICLLQCRPLQILDNKGTIKIPEADKDQVLFNVKNSSMGITERMQIDAVVLVDAKVYHEMPYRNKGEVAGLIEKINDSYRKSGKKLMLISPGRVGTSSPDLGVGISRWAGDCPADRVNKNRSPAKSQH